MAKPAKKLSPEAQAAKDAAEQGEILPPEEYAVMRATQIWGYDDTGHTMSLEEQLFVRSYMIDRNPIAALRRLNYTQPVEHLKKTANKYLANAEVQGAIETLGKQMMKKLEVTAEKIQERLAAVAFFDPREVMQFDHHGVTLLHSSLWPKHAIMALQSIETGQFGPKLKLYDSLRAAEMLAKQVGLQPDENSEEAQRAARAAGEAVVQKIFEIFDRTIKDDPAPPQQALPAPATKAKETKH